MEAQGTWQEFSGVTALSGLDLGQERETSHLPSAAPIKPGDGSSRVPAHSTSLLSAGVALTTRTDMSASRLAAGQLPPECKTVVTAAGPMEWEGQRSVRRAPASPPPPVTAPQPPRTPPPCPTPHHAPTQPSPCLF